ncbi:tetratricopeptide repeat protein [Portibacter marinus]|uniref:tetratricopeptide repeat protein n=1 Tax=Portibacter marinus TaxID=2898660 RepID=UPI001F175478|nr:tetratricopeptide repeat protein [Portibacter marinus]
MTYSQLSARLELLFNQQRFDEAETLLHAYLEENPTDEYAQYMLCIAYYSQNKLERAEAILENLIRDNPEEQGFLALSARIDIVRDLLPKAEEKIELLIAEDPQDPEFYHLMASVKFKQRNYDQAMYFADKALAIDPEDLQALNLRTTCAGILGRKEDAQISIQEALQHDPDNDWTIANHGQQLLREGRVEEALERFKEALSKNPNNELAQYGLTEALKSRFWPYKMFYKYQMLMSRMTSQQMWILMIGAYLALRFLSGMADRNPEMAPFLNPVVYLIVAVFLGTWIIQPLMNLYLLTNKYGKFLLDQYDKMAARYVGIALLLAIITLVFSFVTNQDALLLLVIFFVAMMIPLGTMFNPPTKSGRQKTVLFTIGILLAGLAGFVIKMIIGSDIGIMITFGGIFIYQWVLNGIMIKAGSRVIDR